MILGEGSEILLRGSASAQTIDDLIEAQLP